jgi:hypothetical protein
MRRGNFYAKGAATFSVKRNTTSIKIEADYPKIVTIILLLRKKARHSLRHALCVQQKMASVTLLTAS